MFDSDYEELDIPKKSMKEYEISDSIIENGKISTQSIAHFVLLISEEISNSINSYIKNKKISITVFFITLYSYILSKYSGQENVYTSLINANRNNHYIENMIGMFVTTQPILLKFDNGEVSFEKILKENINVLMNVYKNNNLSFSELKQKLNLKSINNTFIFQPKAIVNPLSMKDYPSIFNEEEYQESLSLYENNNSKFDITFTLIEGENNYSINIIYDNNIYEESIIKGIANSYLEIIQNIKRYDQKIKDIEYISKEERKKILNQFNNNVCKNDFDKVYHVEFSKVAKKYSNKCAIICGDVKMTYKELDEKNNSLAHCLRKIGVNRGDIIPVITERSHYYVLASFAVIKRKDDIYDDEFDDALSICKFTHDISIGELYYPLLRENRIIVTNEEEYNNPKLLSNLIVKYEIKYIFTVPSRIEKYINDKCFLKSLKNVKWILLGGEYLNINTAEKIVKNNNARLFSVYGQAETTVVSNIKDITDINQLWLRSHCRTDLNNVDHVQFQFETENAKN
ncbi:acetyl-CoA synthetase-like protein [Neocallimastix sp. 'constans']